MQLKRYNPYDRHRKRARQQTIGLLVFLAVCTLLFVFGVKYGQRSSEARISGLSKELNTLLSERNEFESRMTAMQAEVQTAAARRDQMEEQINQIVPEDGPMRALVDQLRARLGEGADPERLAFAIRSSRPPKNCTDPETKRFVVSTPTYSGADSTISVDRGALIVSGTGESSKNASGAPEAWFDPALPVEIRFTRVGGEVETKKGILPMHYSTVVGEREYRFTLSEGNKSFARVTFDSCDYP